MNSEDFERETKLNQDGFPIGDFLRSTYSSYNIAPFTNQTEQVKSLWEELASKNPDIKKGWDKFNDDVNKANELTKEAFENAESFFRGTGIDELDGYLKTGNIGTGKADHRYQFTAVSPNREASEEYSTGVTIEYDGDDVRKKGTPVEYDIFWREYGEHKETKENGKMAAFYMDQMEVRMDKEIPLKEMKIKNIYLTKKNAHLADKYKKLGNVIIGGRAGAYESIDSNVVKSIFKTHGDGKESIDTIAYELGRWLGYDFEESKKELNKLIESICPDCGESVDLSGPHPVAQIKKKKRHFEFVETTNDVWKEVAEARFKAFTHSSSFVGNVKYDQDNQTMEIILNGKKYEFCNVSERLFDAFEGADSKGAFFNREIKSLHDC